MHPDPKVVLTLIEAFRWSKTMFAGASLGIFDLLGQQGALTAQQTAATLHLNQDATERLLDGCVALELLTKSPDGAYGLTPAADRYLRSDSEHTLVGYVLYSNSALIPMWSH